jgi:hypothetical protein
MGFMPMRLNIRLVANVQTVKSACKTDGSDSDWFEQN